LPSKIDKKTDFKIVIKQKNNSNYMSTLKATAIYFAYALVSAGNIFFSAQPHPNRMRITTQKNKDRKSRNGR